MDCWYSRYSGVTALLLATTSAAPTKLKTVMTAGERARRRTARGGAGRDDPRKSVGMTDPKSQYVVSDEQDRRSGRGLVQTARYPALLRVAWPHRLENTSQAMAGSWHAWMHVRGPQRS